MSRPTFITAYCGHTTTQLYLDRQPLGCCASCAKKLDRTDTLKRFEEIRQQIKTTCRTCREEIHPLEQSTLPVGVFWKSITVEKAAELTVNAHIRHAHSDYDQRRYDLQAKGYDSKEARSIVREEGRYEAVTSGAARRSRRLLNSPQSLLFSKRIRAVNPKHAFEFQLLVGTVPSSLCSK